MASPIALSLLRSGVVFKQLKLGVELEGSGLPSARIHCRNRRYGLLLDGQACNKPIMRRGTGLTLNFLLVWTSGPVGSGKTALVLQLCRTFQDQPLAVVTNDIFTQEDAEYLVRNNALAPDRIRAVETGGCPHAAIREDVSANLSALEDLTQLVRRQSTSSSDESTAAKRSHVVPLLLCESGGDNLAANFSRELADLTLYVIDVAGGDKVPRKGGPGITQSDLLIINKVDLAPAVGADLDVMQRDATKMRGDGPSVFASVKEGTGMPEIQRFILEMYRQAMSLTSP